MGQKLTTSELKAYVKKHAKKVPVENSLWSKQCNWLLKHEVYRQEMIEYSINTFMKNPVRSNDDKGYVYILSDELYKEFRNYTVELKLQQ